MMNCEDVIMMIKNTTISITLAALVAMVCLFAVAAPVSAGINVMIDPSVSEPGATPKYTFVVDYLMDDCDIYFVNVTIPRGYTATDPVDCDCSEISLTLRNESGGLISKSVASLTDGKCWVNVTGTAYDGLYGPFDVNCSAGEVTEICMAYIARMRLTMPTATTDGSIHISLGPLGPLTPGDSMELEIDGCIKNPLASGLYTWFVTADPCGYTGSDTVTIPPPVVSPPVPVPVLSRVGMIVLVGMLAIVLAISVKRKEDK